MIADEILKTVEYDNMRLIFNRFNSVVAFVPTVATILSPEVRPSWAAHSSLLQALLRGLCLTASAGKEDLTQGTI